MDFDILLILVTIFLVSPSIYLMIKRLLGRKKKEWNKERTTQSVIEAEKEEKTRRERERLKTEVEGEIWRIRNRSPSLSEEQELEIQEMLDESELKHENELTDLEEEPKSRRVPSHVRQEVWKRDKGRCVKCRGKEDLEFDHIIPVAEGGSNTVKNIQLLCKVCNT